MRLYKLSLVIVLAASLIACGSVMKLVGKFSAAAMSVKVADVSDLTAFVKLASYNRPRPLLAMEKEWVKDRGMSDTEVKSHAFLMLTKGMKFAEVDGVVKVNDQPMDFMGNGVYTRTGEMTSGSKQTFFLKGKDGAPVEFTETYSGERMEIQSPASGDVLDLSQGFDVTWSPGMDAGKVVRVSLIVEQMGLENLIFTGFPATSPPWRSVLSRDRMRSAYALCHPWRKPRKTPADVPVATNLPLAYTLVLTVSSAFRP